MVVIFVCLIYPIRAQSYMHPKNRTNVVNIIHYIQSIRAKCLKYRGEMAYFSVEVSQILNS